MIKGKVLVISNDSVVCYHAQRDLSDCAFVTVKPEEEAVILIAQSGDFDAIVLNIKGRIEESKLLPEFKKVKLEALIIIICDDYLIQDIDSMRELGVFDFLPAAFEPKNLYLAVKQALLVKKIINNAKNLESKISALEKQIIFFKSQMEGGSKDRLALYRNLQEAYMRLIKALAQTIDMRDKYTASHSSNVAKFATTIAGEMGLGLSEIKDIHEACELHDIGKIGIEDSILVKQGSLTDIEWAKMREHPLKGAEILQHLDLKMIAQLVKEHHEHYDGSGYPEGKKKDDILLGARIITLADSYDAMTSARAYRKKYFSKREAVEEIKKNSGRQFDPLVVEAFLKVVDKIG